MKKSLLAMALAASMTTAALASDQQTPEFANNAFTQTDIQALFGQDGQHAVQLASLSAQEMQETEGAWLHVRCLALLAELSMGQVIIIAFLQVNVPGVVGVLQLAQGWQEVPWLHIDGYLVIL